MITAFDEGTVAHAGEDVGSADEADLLARVPAFASRCRAHRRREPGGVASAVEFILEGLHLSKRLNKDAVGRPRHLPQPGLNRERAQLPVGRASPSPCRAAW